ATNRILTALSLALADAAIAAWDVKYTYTTWRPITAIPQRDSIGDSTILPEAAWTSFLTTPNHPEYVSGHSTFSRAAATILDNFFGTTYSFSTPGAAGAATVTRSFAIFDAAATEAGRSRIFAGIHFQFANTAGQNLGRSVAEAVLQKLGIHP